MNATDRTVQRVQRHDALRRRERTIVNRLLSALEIGDWDTVHSCDRALGRINKGKAA